MIDVFSVIGLTIIMKPLTRCCIPSVLGDANHSEYVSVCGPQDYNSERWCQEDNVLPQEVLKRNKKVVFPQKVFITYGIILYPRNPKQNKIRKQVFYIITWYVTSGQLCSAIGAHS